MADPRPKAGAAAGLGVLLGALLADGSAAIECRSTSAGPPNGALCPSGGTRIHHGPSA